MAIRHLVLAALVSSAFSAHAGVIPATNQTGLLSGWTVGDGAVNVLGALGSADPAGLAANNLSMVAGVTYGRGASLDSNGLANALLGSANSKYGQSQNGALNQSKLYFTQGIEGFYLISSAKFSGSGMSGMAGSAVFPVATVAGGSFGGTGAQTGSTGGASAGGSGALMPDQLAQPAALDANAVPEPATGALMLAGLAGVGFMARRRSR